MLTNFSKIIFESRKALNLNQINFGKALFPNLEMSDSSAQSLISRFETGKQEPTLTEIKIISEFLKMPILDFFKDETTKDNSKIIKFPSNNNSVTDQYQEYRIMLDEIYESNNKVMISAINSNIVAFHETVKMKMELKDALDRIRTLEAKGG